VDHSLELQSLGVAVSPVEPFLANLKIKVFNTTHTQHTTHAYLVE
jgi:hypothetical protein